MALNTKHKEIKQHPALLWGGLILPISDLIEINKG